MGGAQAMEVWDSIIVGGGLAGSAFAIEQARRGRRALIIERKPDPHHKVCGEFLSHETQTLIAHCGVDIWAEGAQPVNRLILHSGRMATTLVLPFQGAGLSRFRLDEALLEQAARRGVDVRRGVPVSRLETQGPEPVVFSGAEGLSAPNVALATGKLALRHLPRPPSPMCGFKMFLTLSRAARAELAGTVRLFFFPRGYVGLMLVEGEQASLCWICHDDEAKTLGSDWGAHSSFLVRAAPKLGALLEGGRALWPRALAVAGLPFGFLREQPFAPSVYALGDQLAMIPPFTGDGMAIALYSGIEAGRMATEAPMGAARYHRRMVEKLGPQIAWARRLDRVWQSAPGRVAAMAGAKLFPGLAHGLIRRTRLAGFDSPMPQGLREQLHPAN